MNFNRSDNCNKKEKKQQKWNPNVRVYHKPRNPNNNKTNRNRNKNNNKKNNNNNQQHEYNDHNQYQYSNNRFTSNSYSNNYNNKKQQNRRYKSSKYNNSKLTICRAPIEECNTEFMKQVNEENKDDIPGIQTYRYRYWDKTGWQESESLTVGRYFYSKKGTDIQTWKKPNQIIHDDYFDEAFKDYPWKNQVDFLTPNTPKQNISIQPFTLTTNTFPIQLNPNINVLEYEINIQPKTIEDECGSRSTTETTEKDEKKQWKYKNKIGLDKLFKKFDKKKVVKNVFDPYVIDNNSGVLFTFADKDNDEKYENMITFPDDFDNENNYSFSLCSVRSLHFYGGTDNNDRKDDDNDNDDDEEVSPERRRQIFQCILSSILLKTQFKFIKFGPSRGWYPANKNKNLNKVECVYNNPKSAQLRKIGVIRGFKASICNSQNGIALKVSNTNKIVHSETLASELEQLYRSDTQRYSQNVGRFVGRKALYLPTQNVIDITSIQISETEESTFITKRNGIDIEISHKDNLLQRSVVNHVLVEKYGLVGDKHNFSFLPQFCHLLFDQDVSKKQCKDALEYLGKNIDHELSSVNNFVQHIISTQLQRQEGKDLILSLISISNKAITTCGYPLPNLSISFKTDKNNFKNCTETSIGYEWKNIGSVIVEPSAAPMHTLLVGASASMIKKLRTHITNYLQRRKFGCVIIDEMHDYIPKEDILHCLNELKNKLMDAENNIHYQLLILIVPNISDGSKLKRKVHRMCIEFGIKSQCISDEIFYDTTHTKQRNVVWGMMSDIVYKLGATTYQIGDMLFDKIGDINKTMVIGLDICHPTRIKSIERPSIAVMTSLYGNIMTPNIKQQKSSMFFNRNRQEICGYLSTVQMAVNVLTQQLLREDINQLPVNIFFCRDGVSDSQISQMVSKELTALLLAIRKVKKLDNIKSKYKNIKKWKPKIEWIVIQKRILDRFATIDHHNINLNTHSPAFIVPFDVVSGEYFEFYSQIGQRSPKRIIFIKDDLNLRSDGIIEVAQFIYATHWLYPPCIPFQMGPLNICGTIKFADHYASMWQDMVNNDDVSINDIKTNKNLHNPQLVTLHV